MTRTPEELALMAPTSRKLAAVLNDAGFCGLAMRAELNEFHDYFSPHALPTMRLADELAKLVGDTKLSERTRLAAHHIRLRVIDGEFDASQEESDEWAASPEGQAAFAELSKDMRKKP